MNFADLRMKKCKPEDLLHPSGMASKSFFADPIQRSGLKAFATFPLYPIGNNAERRVHRCTILA